MLIRKMILQAPDNAPSGGGSSAPAAPASTPAPVAAPSLAPASSAAPAASGGSSEPSGGTSSAPSDAFDFAALANYSLDGGATPGEPVPVPLVEPAPAATPPAVTPPAPAAVAPPVQAPTEPVAQPATPATAQPPASSAQPPQQVNMEEHRQKFLPKLQEMYKLSEQEVQDFQTNPGEALPKLAAMLHYNVTLAMQAAIAEYLPQVVESHTAQRAQKSEFENTFYGKFPQLKEAVAKDRGKVEGTINQAIAAFRATNPQATIEQLMNQVGLLSMITLGLNPQQLQQSQQAPPAVVAPSIIPGRPAGTGNQGHVPARPHGAAPDNQTESELFGGIADHWNSGG